MSGRMVSAEEARQITSGTALVGYRGMDLAHTVVVQAEQIAAVLALCEKWQKIYNTPMRETDTTVQAIVYQVRAAFGAKS